MDGLIIDSISRLKLSERQGAKREVDQFCTMALWTAVLILAASACASAKRFSIMAPNVFHLGVDVQVSVSVFDANQPVTVKIYLQDYPQRQKTFSQVQGLVEQGRNTFLSVKVNPEDLPDPSSVDKQFVYLIAKSDDGHFRFHKEAKILLSYKSGMVFIQTDKPVYTPKQSVKIRVFPLEFDMKPSRRKINLIVLNPQGVRVQQWKGLDTSTGIISQRLHLADYSISGNWTVTAMHGHQDLHNTSVKFEVKEYVLPKFFVKISVPNFLLKTDVKFTVDINARYTYGNPVLGYIKVKLSIAGHNGTIVPFYGPHMNWLNESGTTPISANVQSIRRIDGGRYWFPEKSRLLVEVDVMDKATGNKESAVDNSCQFTSTPYLVEFKNTAKYFKPGLRYVVKVVVTYPNKQPAANVPVVISAKGRKDGKEQELRKFKDKNSGDKTDEKGEAEFVVDACSKCDAILIQVKTDDGRLDDSQNAVANYIAKPFNAENGPLIMVRQLSHGQVGRKLQCESYRSLNDGSVKLSFAVVSRGRILSHSTTESFDGIFKSWSFLLSSQMSPSARLIAYYIDSNERVVADSILLRVEDSLPTKVEFSYEQKGKLNEVETEPGRVFFLKVSAPEGTRLGLLGVDQSVYLLRNENRFTKDRIFKTAEELDLGCGVGGGRDSKDVFKNAGVVLMTNNFVSDGREDYGCDAQNFRKKRSIDDDDKVCCEFGRNIGNETCVKQFLDTNRGLSTICRRKAWECCTEKHGLEDAALQVLGRSADAIDDLGDEQIIAQTQIRSFFPETWIYTEQVVGSQGFMQMPVTVPDTITTWIMQAVAINNNTGLGLATPLRIVGSRKFFVSLRIPYSVKRGEQVAVLATVFNYHDVEARAKLFIEGDKDYCSIATKGQRATFGVVAIPPQNARSVSIPIVPKRLGEIELKIFVIFRVKIGNQWYPNSDAVRRKILVVPEGKEHRKSQSFVLDPNGNLRDGPKNGENEASEATEPAFQSQTQVGNNGQLDIINITYPKEAVPGSVEAMIYLTGNLLGPVVNTTIEGGLEKFFRMPSGCGEQTMIYLAPNVYVLDYLINTDQLTGAHEENAYRFIQSGYARELNYRRDDMSFSAWKHRPGSTWLTAFVMRVFCKAQKFAGVNVDEKTVCRSVAWLINNQRADGALHEVNHVIHREMVGGAYTEGDVAMTAFVLSALAECKCGGENSEAAILRGKSYLEKQYMSLNKPYSMALTAYALSLLESPKRFSANDRLVQKAIYDKAKKSRRWNAGNNALNVETAGYALLTQIILDRTGYAGSIVTYLTNQRKGGVGFVSTQDTVVALQALALYSEKTKGNDLDLRVKVIPEDDTKGQPPEIHITPENALLQRQINVKRYLGGALYVETKGTGVGLLEVEVRYNLPSTSGEECKFSITTSVREIRDKNVQDLFGPLQKDVVDMEEEKRKKEEEDKKGKGKKKCKGTKNNKKCKRKKKKKTKPPKKPQKVQPVKSIHLKVCTRYLGQNYTGMSIMDIGLLTGFRPHQKSLKKLQDNVEEVDQLEDSDRSLVVYLSEIPNDRELCVDVQLDREYFVGVVQPVPVNVYDYYEPEEYCSKFYGPRKNGPLTLGVCDEDFQSICKCTQDLCAPQDPPIGDPANLQRIACSSYDYVMKGKVLLIGERGAQLNYDVEVVQIIQQGHKELIKTDIIKMRKPGTCHSPDLKENQEYLFMGLDGRDRYDLDETSFVKLWPTGRRNMDKKILDGFASTYVC